jgi:hypothetical protein
MPATYKHLESKWFLNTLPTRAPPHLIKVILVRAIRAHSEASSSCRKEQVDGWVKAITPGIMGIVIESILKGERGCIGLRRSILCSFVINDMLCYVMCKCCALHST